MSTNEHPKDYSNIKINQISDQTHSTPKTQEPILKPNLIHRTEIANQTVLTTPHESVVATNILLNPDF